MKFWVFLKKNDFFSFLNRQKRRVKSELDLSDLEKNSYIAKCDWSKKLDSWMLPQCEGICKWEGEEHSDFILMDLRCESWGLWWNDGREVTLYI